MHYVTHPLHCVDMITCLCKHKHSSHKFNSIVIHPCKVQIVVKITY